MADGIPGQELAVAEWGSPLALISRSVTSTPGSVLSAVVLVPPCKRLWIEVEIPFVIWGATIGYLSTNLLEDGNSIAACTAPGTANGAVINAQLSRSWAATPGNHQYDVVLNTNAGGVTCSVFGGITGNPAVTFMNFLRIAVGL